MEYFRQNASGARKRGGFREQPAASHVGTGCRNRVQHGFVIVGVWGSRGRVGIGRSARSERALEPSDRILGSSTLTQEPSEKSGTRNRTITRSMSRVWDTAWARMTQYTAITVRYKRAELHTCCKVLPGRTEPTRNPEPRRDWEHFRTNCSRDKPRERRREYSRAWADGAILTKLSVESGSGGHDVWIQVRFTHCRYVA